MIKEVLNQLKTAIDNHDKKTIAACKRILNRSGMDDMTIMMLLSHSDINK